MKEKNLRSIAKAVSWRLTGTTDTFILSFLITGKLSYASAISATEVITKIALYYLHERIWNFSNWGKSTKLPLHKKQNLHQIQIPPP